MKQLLNIEKEARQFAKDQLGGFVQQTDKGRADFDALFRAKRAELIASLTGQQVNPAADEVIAEGTRPERAVTIAKQAARSEGLKTEAEIKRRAAEVIQASPNLSDEEKKQALKILNTRTLATQAGEFLNRIFGPAIQAFQGKRPFIGEPPKKTLRRLDQR